MKWKQRCRYNHGLLVHPLISKHFANESLIKEHTFYPFIITFNVEEHLRNMLVLVLTHVIAAKQIFPSQCFLFSFHIICTENIPQLFITEPTEPLWHWRLLPWTVNKSLLPKKNSQSHPSLINSFSLNKCTLLLWKRQSTRTRLGV